MVDLLHVGIVWLRYNYVLSANQHGWMEIGINQSALNLRVATLKFIPLWISAGY